MKIKIHKILTYTFFSMVTLFVSNSAWALSQVEQSYAERLANGGSSSISSVASSIVRISDIDPEMYDIAAEVLLRDYQKANSAAAADALAWVTKALLASGDSRYVPVLEEVKQNASHAKLKKYAKSTGSKLRKKATKSSPPYTKGMVKLSKYKRSPAAKRDSRSTNGGTVSISEIKPGMSAAEVYALCGHPTSEAANMTGKAFNPFNFTGKGNVRTQALYKGQGTIVFENTSSYTAGRRVVEVILDEYEPGYR